MKTSQIIPKCTFIFLFFLHTVLYCFHWEHQQVEGVRSARGGSLRYEGIGQIQNWYVILKGENVSFHWDINLSAILENFTNYTQVYIHISFFSSHCIVLFPLRAPASWRSAKCTRRLFKVWRNWPNSKLICYSERGERRLLFEYKFVGHSWKLHKLYPSVHSYFSFSSHCIVLFPLRAPASWRSAKCTRRLFKVWRNWPNSKLICYSERGERRLSFAYKFVGHSWKLHKLYLIVHSYFFFFLHTVLYCFHWEHQQVEGVRSARGGSLRYEGIGQIQNWCVILKGENVSFYWDINLSAILENFTNYTQVYIHISFCFFTLYCIVSTENTSKLKECEVHMEAL